MFICYSLLPFNQWSVLVGYSSLCCPRQRTHTRVCAVGLRILSYVMFVLVYLENRGWCVDIHRKK